MDQRYWLRRRSESAAMARNAQSSEARLIHLELAGRYSVLAAQCGADSPSARAHATALAQAHRGPLQSQSVRSCDAVYYSQLQAGAEYLATQAADPSERKVHLDMARVYAGRSREAVAVREQVTLH